MAHLPHDQDLEFFEHGRLSRQKGKEEWTTPPRVRRGPVYEAGLRRKRNLSAWNCELIDTVRNQIQGTMSSSILNDLCSWDFLILRHEHTGFSVALTEPEKRGTLLGISIFKLPRKVPNLVQYWSYDKGDSSPFPFLEQIGFRRDR
eukprot:TRINITY_DN620_c0_g1_i14.p1 TRINITY_DN620_c0_g1~~TRINITY_DN620_c0_g1_i14.p1  ORF type:complete len:146 (-),score=11.65 TRINITY_DN620_c0_g1_i14:33-470(-)